MKKKSQRMKAFVLAVCMLVSILGGISAKPRTVYAADDYPTEYKNLAKDACVDKWNFYNRECTSFVAWCLNARNGVAFHNYYGGVQWGHAKNWGNAARRCGFTVDMNPEKGSIWWSSSGTYGHVAWVSSVNGNNVHIEEYNYGNNGNYHERTVAANSATGYIHIKDIPVGNNPKGCLDGAEGGTNTVRVRGWAFDQDAVSQPVEIHVYIGGPAGVGEGHGGIIANVCREDVNNVFGAGIYHGFDASIRTRLTGTQTVYVYAINIGAGTNNPLIGTKTVNISKDTTAPTISDVRVTDLNSEGYTVTCSVEDTDGVAKVQFPTWTAANDQDDLANNWWDNPSCSGIQDGTIWSFRVNDKDHNFERGIYRTHIYAYDVNGNSSCYELNHIELQNTYSHVNTASYHGHTYYLYNDILTWDEAKAKCEELGGHLVTITSTNEQETVAALIQGQARRAYWIGGRNDNGSAWVSGEEFSFHNWEPGEPNGVGGEDRYGIYTDKGTWNDWLGSNKFLGFICEWDEKKEEHIHAYTGAWKSDAESHWKECGCGAKSETQKHDFGNWEIKAQATCTDSGLRGRKCAICGYEETQKIAKTEHSYTDIVTKATAKKDGSIVEKCSKCGKEKSKTVIYAVSKIALSKTYDTYNGKMQKPSVTVKDSKGKALKKDVDYTVSFPKGMKNVGRYTVTVALKGNYSGTISETFDIVPKGTSISKVTAKKKGFTAKWRKQANQATGYEIAYSTSGKFAKKATKITDAGNSKATSKTVSKLKAKKKYYVRIRIYKTVKVNGKSVKLYSDWSKAKTVTTKK